MRRPRGTQKHLMKSAAYAAALLTAVSTAALAQEAFYVAPVTITALSGAETPIQTAPVQTAIASQIAASHAIDIAEYMRRNLSGVFVNDIQNNPLQPDLNYRGYVASPLLGTPQGLSVYFDGVRVNQPFGDVVSWDLIPRNAVASILLAPGSNPLFGLNTLGGALSIKSKDGRTNPGGSVQLGYGSYNRQTAEAEQGGSSADGVHHYVAANMFSENGWRDASPTDSIQLFGKVGKHDDKNDVAVSVAFADSDLTGNGLQDGRLLARDRSSVYTKPDETHNRSGSLTMSLEHRFSEETAFSGVLYHRQIKSSTYNGDINDEALTESVYQPSAAERAALAAAGVTGVPEAGETSANTPFPSFRCLANGLLNSEPGEKCNGMINRTATSQRQTGISGQFAFSGDASGNQLIVGGALEESLARFTQSSQFAYLTPNRGVKGITGPGAFADGTQDSEEAYDARVRLSGRVRTASVYGADSLQVGPAVTVIASGRYNYVRVENRDANTPGGGPGSLDGDHTFGRINPAISVAYSSSSALAVYGSVGEGSRAPSTIELGCADPDNPCRLPNALAGDPPLKQVVTRTGEIGARGRLSEVLSWRASGFYATNRNDILFVADDLSGFGYFKNFGKTRRQGVELDVDGAMGAFRYGANYTYLKATYRSEEGVGGAGNSTNDTGPGFEGNIDIEPGDRIPLIPSSLFKANIAWDVTNSFTLSADVSAVSGVYARGNENNQHKPDGVYYLGPGKTDAYAVLNMGAEYRPTQALKILVQVNNVFDNEYETAAQLGATGFTDTGSFIARPFTGPIIDGERPTRNVTFFAPGAPRIIWVGVRYAFGR